jgi:hypothetical protein
MASRPSTARQRRLGISHQGPAWAAPNWRTRIIESLGAHHIIHQQRLNGLPIHRAYVTVHLAKGGRVYLVKNRAVPRDLLEPSAEFKIAQTTARKGALRSATRNSKLAKIVACEQNWFPLKSKLRPAYRVRVRCHTPRQDWIIFVDGDTGRILRKYGNLAEATGVAFVFDPNPAATLAADQLLHNGRPLPPPETAYTRVTLRGLNASGWSSSTASRLSRAGAGHHRRRSPSQSRPPSGAAAARLSPARHRTGRMK